MLRLIKKINNEFMPKFGIRVERFSSYRAREEERKRLATLASSSVARQRILELAQLLKPQDAIGQTRVRIGDAFDGGYVCLNDFDGVATAFSFGISNNSSWDREIADRGMVVHQFDHTVDAPPDKHPNFRFERKKIVPAGEETASAQSITSLLALYPAERVASMVMKMDIEHDEWKVLFSASDAELAKFSQIICELHEFSRVIEDGWYSRARQVLEKLHRGFEVVHFHANNCAPWSLIGNVPFPEVIEMTYANRMRYQFRPTEERFPISVDAPNDPTRPDMFLGRFELWPSPETDTVGRKSGG